MLENLSKRERTLTLVVVSLLPLMAVFFAVTWFTSQYFDRRGKIRVAQQQINVEKEKQLEAELASERRALYRELSLPGGNKQTDVLIATTSYEQWIQDLVKNRLKMDFRSWQPRTVVPVTFSGRNGRTLVCEKHPFTLQVDGTLKQLTALLYEMRTLELLHRITSIKLTPLNAGSGAKKTRTGGLALSIDIEVLALTDAEKTRAFLETKKELAQSLDDYNEKIVSRNIFGPANNAPSLALSEQKTVFTGSDVSFTITGKDADENDLLSFELGDSTVEDAGVSSSDGSRTAKFTCPELAPGEYPFLVRVTDSGYPPKSFEQLFTLVVKEKPAPPPPPVVVEKPKFKHAGQTAVKSVTTNVDGVQQVGIRVMTTDQRFVLKVGDSFELDNKVWTVKSMTSEEVVIEVDGKSKTYHVGDRLEQPSAEP